MSRLCRVYDLAVTVGVGPAYAAPASYLCEYRILALGLDTLLHRKTIAPHDHPTSSLVTKDGPAYILEHFFGIELLL